MHPLQSGRESRGEREETDYTCPAFALRGHTKYTQIEVGKGGGGKKKTFRWCENTFNKGYWFIDSIKKIVNFLPSNIAPVNQSQGSFNDLFESCIIRSQAVTFRTAFNTKTVIPVAHFTFRTTSVSRRCHFQQSWSWSALGESPRSVIDLHAALSVP